MFIATMAVGQVPDLAGAAYRQPLGNPRPRHCRLPAQARGEGDFLRVAFGTRSQLAAVLPVVFIQSCPSRSAKCSSVSLRSRDCSLDWPRRPSHSERHLDQIRRAHPLVAPEGVPLARGSPSPRRCSSRCWKWMRSPALSDRRPCVHRVEKCVIAGGTEVARLPSTTRDLPRSLRRCVCAGGIGLLRGGAWQRSQPTRSLLLIVRADPSLDPAPIGASLKEAQPATAEKLSLILPDPNFLIPLL